MRIASGTTLVFSWLLAGLALAAAPALGATRHAAPEGTSEGACPIEAPCDLRTAVQGAGSGDVVELEPGTYVESERITAFTNVAVRGPELPDRAVLESSADYALSLNAAGSSVSWLTIEHSGAFGALYLAGAHADHVFAHSSAGDQSTNACWFASSISASTLEEGVCWNSASGRAIHAAAFSGLPITATVRNVTAVASGTGTAAQALYANAGLAATTSFTGTGLIASGTAAAGGDVDAWAANGGSTTVTLSYSNYSNTRTNEFADGTATVTPTAENGNQAAEPHFQDPGNGSFRQAAGSPTIDGGDPAAVASVDLDGKARPLGAAIDIGAYEADPVPDTTAPRLVLAKRPPKVTRKRRATFRFRATDDVSPRGAIRLRCRLDNRKFRGCRSPRTYKRLKRGRHVFRVRAIDEAGNSTKVRWRWRIKR